MTVEQLEIVITANCDDLEAKLSDVSARFALLEQNALAASAAGISAVAENISAENIFARDTFADNNSFLNSQNGNINNALDNSIAELISAPSAIMSVAPLSTETDSNRVLKTGINAGTVNTAAEFNPDEFFKKIAVEPFNTADNGLEGLLKVNFPETPLQTVKENDFSSFSNILDSYYAPVNQKHGNDIFTDMLANLENPNNRNGGNTASERNTFSDSGSGGQTAAETRVVLELDGDVIAETVVNYRNKKITRTNGLTE